MNPEAPKTTTRILARSALAETLSATNWGDEPGIADLLRLGVVVALDKTRPEMVARLAIQLGNVLS
jgi:hypothetical protein